MNKECTKCGESKPATLEFFYCDKGKKDGFTSHCKTCTTVKRNVIRPCKCCNKLVKGSGQLYCDDHKPTKSNYNKVYYHKAKDALPPHLVKSSIARLLRHKGLAISYKDIPDELIETKRKELCLKRKLKQLQSTSSNKQ